MNNRLEKIAVVIPHEVETQNHPVLMEVNKVREQVKIHLNMQEYNEYIRLLPTEREEFIDKKARELTFNK